MPKKSELKVSEDAARVWHSPTNFVGNATNSYPPLMLDDFSPQGASIDNCSLSARFFLDWAEQCATSQRKSGPWNENYARRETHGPVMRFSFHERRASKIHLAVCDRGRKRSRSRYH